VLLTEGAKALGEMLSHTRVQITSLKLCGNLIHGEALQEFCCRSSPVDDDGGGGGLAQNKRLTHLWMTDNRIVCRSDDAEEQLNTFAECLAAHPSLIEVDLQYNPIGDRGATALLPVVAIRQDSNNKTTLGTFLIDKDTISEPLYRQLYRKAGPPKKSSKKKKGAGTKKKKAAA
jgi:hypothetical protein